MSEPADTTFDDGLNCTDERHIAVALYLLQKAMTLRELPDHMGWPEIHACLRDAATHCEKARQRWTKEAMVERQRVLDEIFGVPVCPCCNSSERVERSGHPEYGEFFCPCNCSGPQYFNRDGSGTLVCEEGAIPVDVHGNHPARSSCSGMSTSTSTGSPPL